MANGLSYLITRLFPSQTDTAHPSSGPSNTPTQPAISKPTASAVSSPAPVSKKLTISDGAFNLIVREEDGSEAYYTRHYTHFEWPAGASGPTIGIGYDCGYVTRMEAAIDWDGIVDTRTLQHIQDACGKKGSSAEEWVRRNRGSVTIPWDQAIKEFRGREVPKWIGRVSRSLPHTDQLSPDSFGALVSLAYNRGASFDLPGARFSEMREIKHCMIVGQYARIPAEIRSMKRLWRPNSDLWNRREHEAQLFERGLVKS